MGASRTDSSYSLTTPHEVLSRVLDDAVGADRADHLQPSRAASGRTSLAETETLDGRQTHAVYGASENGGYLSVTSTNAYATTRVPHRMAPCTKSNMLKGSESPGSRSCSLPVILVYESVDGPGPHDLANRDMLFSEIDRLGRGEVDSAVRPVRVVVRLVVGQEPEQMSPAQHEHEIEQF
jgi:hypothetical protein